MYCAITSWDRQKQMHVLFATCAFNIFTSYCAQMSRIKSLPRVPPLPSAPPSGTSSKTRYARGTQTMYARHVDILPSPFPIPRRAR
jgi:hypothetical protein